MARTLARVWRVCSRRVGPAGVGAWPSTAGRKPTWPATWRRLPFLTPWENFAGGVVWVFGVSAILSVIRVLQISSVIRCPSELVRRSVYFRACPSFGVLCRCLARVLPADGVRGAAYQREQSEEFVGADDDIGRGDR